MNVILRTNRRGDHHEAS